MRVSPGLSQQPLLSPPAASATGWRRTLGMATAVLYNGLTARPVERGNWDKLTTQLVEFQDVANEPPAG